MFSIKGRRVERIIVGFSKHEYFPTPERKFPISKYPNVFVLLSEKIRQNYSHLDVRRRKIFKTNYIDRGRKIITKFETEGCYFFRPSGN